ncbi:MAG: sigma-70 family RNA polymerase sigma factor [Acidimicrobiales bacterium]|nr:sigma-70 family RNA polymerase sigma factor [Acidimicrobiales bacterium]
MHPLVASAADGSNAAWTQIVSEYGPSIRGFARARGVDDPDGLTQEVFLDAARSVGSFDGDEPAFRSWLFTIAYRRVADHHRRTNRRPRTVGFDGTELRAIVDGPESRLERSETVAELMRELDRLSELERDVVLLRIVGELSSDEVARVVGKTPGNVRVIQARALGRIRDQLKKKSVTNPIPERLLS